jgi:hypothetical protein
MKRTARDLIEDFRPEKFPALSSLTEGKTADELTALEQTVVLSANDFRAAAETAAAELVALQAENGRLKSDSDMLKVAIDYMREIINHPNSRSYVWDAREWLDSLEEE